MPTAPVDGFGLLLSPVWIDANFPHRFLHISTFPGGDPQALGIVFPGKISPGLGVGSVVALIDVRANVLDDLIHFSLPPNVFAAYAAENILP